MLHDVFSFPRRLCGAAPFFFPGSGQAAVGFGCLAVIGVSRLVEPFCGSNAVFLGVWPTWCRCVGLGVPVASLPSWLGVVARDSVSSSMPPG